MELKPTKAQILWLAEKYNTVPLEHHPAGHGDPPRRYCKS